MVGFSVSSWESDGGMSPLMVVLIAVFAILLIVLAAATLIGRWQGWL